MADNIEKEFAGKKRASVWTYLILGVLLVVIALFVNFAISNPEMAHKGVSKLFGLPAWALATITFVLGVFVYWIGLKVETDWPEFTGAFLIAGSIVALEIILGWKRFEIGLVIVPYIIPLLVFLVLIMVALRRSR